MDTRTLEVVRVCSERLDTLYELGFTADTLLGRLRTPGREKGVSDVLDSLVSSIANDAVDSTPLALAVGQASNQLRKEIQDRYDHWDAQTMFARGK